MKHTIIQGNTPEQNCFVTISDFKQCINRGGEVEFVWKGIHYSITHYSGKISISHSRLQETEKNTTQPMTLWGTSSEATGFAM